MQQWVGASGIVDFAAANDAESSMGIELYSLDILLVNVNASDAVFLDRVSQKSRTNPSATSSSVDKQHFQLSIQDAGESCWATIEFCDR